MALQPQAPPDQHLFPPPPPVLSLRFPTARSPALLLLLRSARSLMVNHKLLVASPKSPTDRSRPQHRHMLHQSLKSPTVKSRPRPPLPALSSLTASHNAAPLSPRSALLALRSSTASHNAPAAPDTQCPAMVPTAPSLSQLPPCSLPPALLAPSASATRPSLWLVVSSPLLCYKRTRPQTRSHSLRRRLTRDTLRSFALRLLTDGDSNETCTCHDSMCI